MKGRKAIPVLLNLDEEDGEDAGRLDDDGEEGDDQTESAEFTERQKEWSKRLDTVLRGCNRCGPQIFCKVAKNIHRPVTFGQRRAWVVELVCRVFIEISSLIITYSQAAGKHGVTLNTPPRHELFHMYFNSIPEENIDTIPFLAGTSSVSQAPAPAPAPIPALGPAAIPAPPASEMSAFMQLQMLQMQMMLGNMSNNNSNHSNNNSNTSNMPPVIINSATSAPTSPSTSKRHHNETLSSDPPDITETNPYPTVCTFFTALAELNPERNLLRYLQSFKDEDFYHLDDIHSLKDALGTLTAPPIKMTIGNATWALKVIEREIKRVDKVMGKRRRTI